MLILFDQGTPVGIRHALPDHVVKTATQQGWSTLLNGELLRAAEEAGFDVFLTTDTNLPFQQNVKGLKLAVIVLSQTRWKLIRAVLPQIAAAITNAKPGNCTLVEIPGIEP